MKQKTGFRLLILGIALGLGACTEKTPLRIGLIGELTGRSADIGESARNGALLAIEQLKELPSLKGRAVEILVRDTGTEAETARKAAQELVAAGVEVIIGPTTSSMVDAVLPVIDSSNIVLVTPTASAVKFHGQDDNLFRINWTTRDNGRQNAEHYFNKGLKRVSVAVNENNRSFTESWLHEFQTAYQAIGGKIVAVTFFDSRSENHGPLIEDLLKPAPDGLILIGNAVDVARLAQQTYKQKPGLPLVAAEWAGSDKLIELGGKAVENLMLVQNYNRDDTSPRFMAFKESYQKRYGKEPDYGSVLAYDAASTVMEALSKRASGGKLKDALLKQGPFTGLQQEITFDANGDTVRTAHFMMIHHGKFVREQ